MSDRTAPSSRAPTPGPAAHAAEPTAASAPAAASSSAPGDGKDAAAAAPSSPRPRASTDTITEATSKIAQHGLYQGSLEEEVGQVMGTLGSFWGGLKKQSASALQTIKKEADRTVQQVQEDFKYLQTAKVEVVRKDAATWEAEQATEREKKDKGKGRADAAAADSDAAAETSGGSDTGTGDLLPALPESATALLSRLSSSTTQLQHTLQSSLHTTLAAAKANPALANPAALRAQLAENVQLSTARANLQLSLAQAERVAELALKRGGAGLADAGKLAEAYVRRGEGWVKDAEKWVEDNVRIVAPDDGTQYVTMGWDGADFYSFSTSAAAPPGDILFDAGGAKGRAPGQGSRGSSVALAGSRKEALLRQLREDKALLLVDPADEGESEARRAQFKAWVDTEFAKAFESEREQEEGNVGTVRMALVPESLTDEQFWQRYLFHKHMLEAEEVRRKALLQATEDQPDDFSWDDDDEAASPALGSAAASAKDNTTPKSTTPVPAAAVAPSAATPGDGPAQGAGADTAKDGAKDKDGEAAPAKSAGTSPRDSEESYDLVSDTGRVAPAPAAVAAVAAPAPAPADDDDDSDWE
ncbi:hypothetical protein Q5752_005254 [Cryptotrichosporon argae]